GTGPAWACSARVRAGAAAGRRGGRGRTPPAPRRSSRPARPRRARHARRRSAVPPRGRRAGGRRYGRGRRPTRAARRPAKCGPAAGGAGEGPPWRRTQRRWIATSPRGETPPPPAAPRALGMVGGGPPAPRGGGAQGGGDTGAVGVRRAQLGGLRSAVLLLGVLVKVHHGSVPKRDRSRLVPEGKRPAPRPSPARGG